MVFLEKRQAAANSATQSADPSPSSLVSSHSPSSNSTQPPQQNSPSDPDAGISLGLGTIMGTLAAAVVGALLLATILGIFKHKKELKKSQSNPPQDQLNEKAPYKANADRKSFDSRSLMTLTATRPYNQRGHGLANADRKSFDSRSLMTLTANRPHKYKQRAHGPYAPPPPSIIEHHQACTIPTSPMPSYQPGQISHFHNHSSQSFDLHRIKPPAYHSNFNSESRLAFTSNPTINTLPTSPPIHQNQNNLLLNKEIIHSKYLEGSETRTKRLSREEKARTY